MSKTRTQTHPSLESRIDVSPGGEEALEAFVANLKQVGIAVVTTEANDPSESYLVVFEATWRDLETGQFPLNVMITPNEMWRQPSDTANPIGQLYYRDVQRVWLGYGDSDNYDPAFVPPHHTLGNTVLLQLYDGSYLRIGPSMVNFSLPARETIDKYVGELHPNSVPLCHIITSLGDALNLDEGHKFPRTKGADGTQEESGIRFPRIYVQNISLDDEMTLKDLMLPDRDTLIKYKAKKFPIKTWDSEKFRIS